MMTNALLTEAIRKDWNAIKAFLPARTATYLRYDKGAKNAVAWNEGGKETKIPLPLQNNGWYVPENPFAIPNGKPSNRDDPDALYLGGHQNREFNGPLGRGYLWFDDLRRRDVSAYVWSNVSGVALITPSVNVPLDLTGPKALVQRAEQLENAAKELVARLGLLSGSEKHTRLIKPTLDEAAFLRELAGKIEAISK